MTIFPFFIEKINKTIALFYGRCQELANFISVNLPRNGGEGGLPPSKGEALLQFFIESFFFFLVQPFWQFKYDCLSHLGKGAVPEVWNNISLLHVECSCLCQAAICAQQVIQSILWFTQPWAQVVISTER